MPTTTPRHTLGALVALLSLGATGCKTPSFEIWGEARTGLSTYGAEEQANDGMHIAAASANQIGLRFISDEFETPAARTRVGGTFEYGDRSLALGLDTQYRLPVAVFTDAAVADFLQLEADARYRLVIIDTGDSAFATNSLQLYIGPQIVWLDEDNRGLTTTLGIDLLTPGLQAAKGAPYQVEPKLSIEGSIGSNWIYGVASFDVGMGHSFLSRDSRRVLWAQAVVGVGFGLE